MFNEKDEPLRLPYGTLFTQNTPLAAKLESTACGPAGEFTDRDHVCQHDLLSHGEISTFSDFDRPNNVLRVRHFSTASYAIVAADDV
jgi:hypothetical protein